MKYIKRFNESSEENKTDMYTGCIDAANNCIEDCEAALDEFKNRGDEDSVIAITEGIMVLELYIYSCENETKNFKDVAELTKSVAKSIGELKSDNNLAKDTCLKLVEEIEKCEDSKEERGVV
jgi:undecaprenyl pyrophosphate synthase